MFISIIQKLYGKCTKQIAHNLTEQSNNIVESTATFDRNISSSILKRLKILIFSAVLGLIILAGFSRLILDRVYEKAIYSNTSTVPGIVALEEAKAHFNQIEVLLYSHYLLGDRSETSFDFENRIAEEQYMFLNYLREYSLLTKHAEDKRLLKQDRKLFQEYQQELATLLNSHTSHEELKKSSLLTLSTIKQRLIEALDDHVRYNIQFGNSNRILAEKMLNDSIWHYVLFLAILVASLLVLSYIISNRLLYITNKFQELKQESAMFSNMIDQVRDVAMIVFNNDQKMVYANNAASKYFEANISKLLALTPAHLGIKINSSTTHAANIEATPISSNMFETLYQSASGEMIPSEIILSKFKHEDKDLHLCFIRNIKDRKAMEAAQEAALTEAKRLIQLRSTFMAQMSHELRTPLNGILGYAQILLKETDISKRQIKGITVIQQSGEHLLMLINDILDFSKIESGKLELSISDIQLDKFLNPIVDIISMQAKQKSISVTSEIETELPKVVRGDDKRLRQVILNLLANAVKFTDYGQIILRVRLLPTGLLRFEVQDTGIGINEDQLEKIFQPFEQACDAQRKNEGSGLGLAISRQIIRLMGGDIQVESRPGQGSSFWFELNLPAVASNAKIEDIHRHIIGYEGPRKKILIINEEVTSNTELHRMLGTLGFEITEITNTLDELEEKVNVLHHDLILIDISAQIIDKKQSTQYLNHLAHVSKNTPTIIISAINSNKFKEKNLATSNFLPIPIDTEKLLAMINSLLSVSWTYSKTEVADSKIVVTQDLLPPPQQALEELHQLALRGNMRNILQWATDLTELDKTYLPFANHISKLANEFQSKSILNLAKHYQMLDQHNQPAKKNSQQKPTPLKTRLKNQHNTI